jgi:hypothetical protein
VFASLVLPGLYDWLRVTCVACGCEPVEVAAVDDQGAMEGR